MILTSEILEKILYNCLDYLKFYDIQMYNSASICYCCGLRFNELNYNNWVLNGASYNVYLSKINGFRTIEEFVLNSEFINYINTQNETNLILSNTTFRNRWNKLKLPNFTTKTSHDVLTHIFRYNYVWLMAEAGYSLAEIATEVGHKNTGTTAAYIAKQIEISDIDYMKFYTNYKPIGNSTNPEEPPPLDNNLIKNFELLNWY